MKIYYHNRRYPEDIIKHKEYDFLFDYPVLIDIGANIGSFSLAMYERCERIYAIEPVKECLDVLRKTVEGNALSKIRLYKEAIASDTGTVDMRMRGDPEGGGWTITDLTGPKHECRSVPAITLLGFMDREHIGYADLVKMDVEGAEGEILNDPTFPFKRIGTIIGELHEGWAENKSIRGFIDIFDHHGIRWRGIGSNKFIGRKQ